MKAIGYFLLTVSFLTAAFFASVGVKEGDSMNTSEVNWIYYGISLAAGIAGVVLIRLGHKMTYHSEEKVAERLIDITTSLAAIAENITKLEQQKHDINTYDVGPWIDKTFNADFEKFVEARKAIAGKYSLQDYAQVMDHFAAGQRYINRVWSASADGYIDEVNEYITRSKDEFLQAQATYQGLK